MTATATHPYTHEIQARIADFADEAGLTVESLAQAASVPVSALTGNRIYLRAIERVARTLKVPVDEIFGFGGCQPWCTSHEDDGESDYCCRRLGVYAEGQAVELWHDAEGTRVNVEPVYKREGTYTPAEVVELAAAFNEAVRVLNESGVEL